MMAIQKLVVQEYEVSEEILQALRRLGSWKVGDKYSYFVDPETGIAYRPVAGFTVTGEDLSDRFVPAAFEGRNAAATDATGSDRDICLLVHQGNVIENIETGHKRCIWEESEQVDPFVYRLVCERPHQDGDYSYLCNIFRYCRCRQ